MSGRLVILPHKSWNVWNADNVEKVLRDERLEKETKEKREKEERSRNQGLIRQELLQQQSIPASICENEAKEEQPFCLFDAPTAPVKVEHNTDFLREKEQKELKQKRHEGSAPLPLGGYDDASSAWYSKNRFGKVGDLDPLVGEKRRRDDLVKNREDPMAATVSKYARTSNLLTEAVEVEGGKQTGRPKERKKERKEKHERKGKTKDAVSGGVSSMGMTEKEMEALRWRRLDREAQERKKAIVLKAAIEFNK